MNVRFVSHVSLLLLVRFHAWRKSHTDIHGSNLRHSLGLAGMRPMRLAFVVADAPFRAALLSMDWHLILSPIHTGDKLRQEHSPLRAKIHQ